MTSGVNNLIRTTNCITQLSNFLPLFIALDGCSSHHDITRFHDNKVPSIVNILGASSVTILDENFQNYRREMIGRVSKYHEKEFNDRI